LFTILGNVTGGFFEMEAVFVFLISAGIFIGYRKSQSNSIADNPKDEKQIPIPGKNSTVSGLQVQPIKKNRFP
jgi:hypothetical protein